MQQRILIVQDDRAFHKALKHLFESAGYAVEICIDARSALEALLATTPAAVILNLRRLPAFSGKDICLYIKHQHPSLPVIVLSASADVVDKVLLLELGADDYVTKPYSPRELLARVQAAIRRTGKPLVYEEAEFDGIRVDFTRMEVIRKGRPIALTAPEFKILKFFLDNEERAVSRDELLEEALGYQDYGSLRTVDNSILKLRQKLERNPANPVHFRTVHGAGYKFVR